MLFHSCCYGIRRVLSQVLKRTLPQPPSIEEMIERLPTLGQRTSNASFVTVGGCVRAWMDHSLRRICREMRLAAAACRPLCPPWLTTDHCTSARGVLTSTIP